MKILVVEPVKRDRLACAEELRVAGHEFVVTANGAEALQRLHGGSFDVVLAELDMPRLDGTQLLKRISSGPRPHPDVVILSARGTIPVAVKVIKLGAFDFLEKPIASDQLARVLDQIEEQQHSAGSANGSADRLIDEEVIGDSPGMAHVKRLIKVAARTDANVLLCGETGVGKDLIASTIHRLSHRRRNSFVKVGCTLFPSSLIENELFGHQMGSFTGADESRPGRFEIANEGTIYLDDLDDIPLEQQSKLLRVIEEKVYERVGSPDLIETDVRVVGSTKANLLERVADGTFRQDLYYRLDVLRIRVPPLRERTGDLPLLAEFLMKRIAGDEASEIEPDALAVLSEHSWPGNVRELSHTLERAWLIGGGLISADLLRDTIAGRLDDRPTPQTAATLPSGGFKAAMDHAEKQLLMNALDASSGNKTSAAESLGMKPSTFRDKLAKHQIR